METIDLKSRSFNEKKFNNKYWISKISKKLKSKYSSIQESCHSFFRNNASWSNTQDFFHFFIINSDKYNAMHEQW